MVVMATLGRAIREMPRFLILLAFRTGAVETGLARFAGQAACGRFAFIPHDGRGNRDRRRTDKCKSEHYGLNHFHCTSF